LVVIAILTVLLAVLMPALSRARESSRRAVCRANLHSAAAAFQGYLAQSNDVFPKASVKPSDEQGGLPRIADVLAVHLGDPKVLKCPSDTKETDYGKTFFDTEGSSYEYAAPMVSGKSLTEVHEGEEKGLKIIIMFDYEPFHGPAGEIGSSSYLFADWTVGDFK